MKILYHFRTQGSGAEGVHIAGIARAFQALGHEVIFSNPAGVDPLQTAGGNPFSGKKQRSLLAALAAKAPRLLFEIMECAYNFVAYARNARLLRAGRFGLIYERHAFFLCATAWLARAHRLPLVVEVNELAGDIRLRAQPLFLPLARWADRQIFRQARLIVVVSPHLKRRIAEYGIDPDRILVLPNAVSAAELEAPSRRAEIRQRLGLQDRIVIGFTGWFVEWHRLEDLVAACAALHREHPALALLLVGDGPLREKLLALAAENGLGSALILPGAVPHSEMPAYLDAMDIGVVPHSNEYRSPIKLFEMMARGLAVLAPSTEPVATIIRPGENGLLFTPASAVELQEGLKNLVCDPEFRTRLGEQAREDIRRCHTWSRNAEQVLAACSHESRT